MEQWAGSEPHDKLPLKPPLWESLENGANIKNLSTAQKGNEVAIGSYTSYEDNLLHLKMLQKMVGDDESCALHWSAFLQQQEKAKRMIAEAKLCRLANKKRYHKGSGADEGVIQMQMDPLTHEFKKNQGNEVAIGSYTSYEDNLLHLKMLQKMVRDDESRALHWRAVLQRQEKAKRMIAEAKLCRLARKKKYHKESGADEGVIQTQMDHLTHEFKKNQNLTQSYQKILQSATSDRQWVTQLIKIIEMTLSTASRLQKEMKSQGEEAVTCNPLILVSHLDETKVDTERYGLKDLVKDSGSHLERVVDQPNQKVDMALDKCKAKLCHECMLRKSQPSPGMFSLEGNGTERCTNINGDHVRRFRDSAVQTEEKEANVSLLPSHDTQLPQVAILPTHHQYTGDGSSDESENVLEHLESVGNGTKVEMMSTRALLSNEALPYSAAILVPDQSIGIVTEIKVKVKIHEQGIEIDSEIKDHELKLNSIDPSYDSEKLHHEVAELEFPQESTKQHPQHAGSNTLDKTEDVLQHPLTNVSANTFALMEAAVSTVLSADANLSSAVLLDLNDCPQLNTEASPPFFENKVNQTNLGLDDFEDVPLNNKPEEIDRKAVTAWSRSSEMSSSEGSYCKGNTNICDGLILRGQDAAAQVPHLETPKQQNMKKQQGHEETVKEPHLQLQQLVYSVVKEIWEIYDLEEGPKVLSAMPTPSPSILFMQTLTCAGLIEPSDGHSYLKDKFKLCWEILQGIYPKSPGASPAWTDPRPEEQFNAFSDLSKIQEYVSNKVLRLSGMNPEKKYNGRTECHVEHEQELYPNPLLQKKNNEVKIKLADDVLGYMKGHFYDLANFFVK